MTKNTVITRIKQTLDDQGVFFTDQDIYDSITDGYNLVALFSGCIEHIAELPIVAGQIYYNVVDEVGDYFRPFAIYNPNSNQFLYPISYKKLEAWDEQWEIRTGTPNFFCICGFDTIALHPHYAAAPTSNLQLFYKAIPPDLASITDFDIPISTQQVLIDYVVGDLMDQALEYRKSSQFFKQFQENLLRTRREVEDMPLKDRCAQMAAMYYGTLDR